jgi:hypothetical protein
MHQRNLSVVATLIALVTLGAGSASAQFITGLESPDYTTGIVQFQQNWEGGGNFPRVQTATEISGELVAAGLNAGTPVHGGDQALLVAKIDTNTESTGYFVNYAMTGLESETKVTVDFWARPLTSGLGADPAGTPAGNGKTIGERQGNTFVGVMDSDATGSSGRTAAVRFGVDTVGSDPYTNVTERHIDFASATAGSAVWVKSGLLWEADQWYNFKFDLDYGTKTYDFFVNDTKVNTTPIQFYHTDSTAANRFFVSRGTNQAGQIIDDISVTVTPDDPITPGDFDGDGDVDGRDFLTWQRDTSVGDLSDWQTNYGMGSLVAATVSVPEPAGFVIGGCLVAIAVGGRLWRR